MGGEFFLMFAARFMILCLTALQLIALQIIALFLTVRGMNGRRCLWYLFLNPYLTCLRLPSFKNKYHRHHLPFIPLNSDYSCFSFLLISSLFFCFCFISVLFLFLFSFYLFLSYLFSCLFLSLFI